MAIDRSRYSIQGDDIWGSFSDYVVHISPRLSNGYCSVQFMKDNSNLSQKSHIIYCSDLEHAFELVGHYSEQVMFDDLMKKLYEDHSTEK